MKYFLIGITIVFLGISTVDAQTTQSTLICSKEKATTDYSTCCSGEARRVNQFVCTNVDIERNLQSQLPTGIPSTRPDVSNNPLPVVLPYADSNLGTCSRNGLNSLLDILIWARCVIGVAVIPLLFTIAFLIFVWGVIQFMRNNDDVKKREESKRFLLWAILALTVLTSVWGLVRIVTVTFGLGNTVPELQTDYLKPRK